MKPGAGVGDGSLRVPGSSCSRSVSGASLETQSHGGSSIALSKSARVAH